MNLNMLYSNFINWYKKLAQGSYGAIIDPDGEYYEVDVMGVPLPPPEFVEAYETKKSAFTTDLNLKIQSQLQAIDLKEQREQRAVTEGVKLTDRQQKIIDLMDQGIVKTGKIAEILGIIPTKVSQSLNFLRKKGINIQKYKEKAAFKSLKVNLPKNQFKFGEPNN